MASSLVAWIGLTDFSAAQSSLEKGQIGPLATAVKALGFDQVFLLHDYIPAKVKAFKQWFSCYTQAFIHTREVKQSSPTFHQVFDDYLQSEVLPAAHGGLTFHLSPGSSAMATVSILLGKTQYPASFIQPSLQQGVVEVDIPFDIVTQNSDVKRLIHKTEKIELRDVPVLIMGESNTGKELFAKAIHNVSLRSAQPLVVDNCGVIPRELVDSELFGYIKGAFTGAANKTGYFEAFDGGTIFLDELPLAAQVRLLQSGEFNRVGEVKIRFYIIVYVKRLTKS